jgi:hypothetical protein
VTTSVAVSPAARMRSFLVRLERLALEHGIAVAGLVIIGIGAWGASVNARPFTSDNFQGLSLATASNPLDYFTAGFSNLPAYRPVTELSLWLQYRILGITPESYFIFNIAVWIGVAVALYALVYLLSGSVLASALAAAVLLLDPRALSAIFVIGDRATSFVALCGLVALMVAMKYRPDGRRARWVEGALVLLLVVGALSKEYGLAFFVAVGLVGLITRREARRQLILVVLAAAGIYAFMRFVVAGGPATTYCETMGIGQRVREACYGHVPKTLGVPAEVLNGWARIKQHGWNIGASFVGTFFPSLFTPDGALNYGSFGEFISNHAHSVVPGARPTGDFFTRFLAAGLAVVAWVRMPRQTLPLLGLIVANALLSLTIYRTRNQIAGVVGVYASAGVGLAILLPWLRSTVGRRAVLGAVLAIVAVWLGWQISLRSQDVAVEKKLVLQDTAASGGLCARVSPTVQKAGTLFNSPEIIEKLRSYYHMPPCP